MYTFVKFVVIFAVEEEVADEFTERGREDGSSDYQQKLSGFEDEGKDCCGFTHLLILYDVYNIDKWKNA